MTFPLTLLQIAEGLQPLALWHHGMPRWRVRIWQASQPLLHLSAPQLLPLQQAGKAKESTCQHIWQEGPPRDAGRGQESTFRTPLVSVLLPEDHRDPLCRHRPLPWRDAPRFSPHVWASKHAPHVLKGSHTEASTSTLETRASAPCFWPRPLSPLKTISGPTME